MYGFVIFMHVIVCILLATVILMQSGRGGGLTEAFSSAESLFGAQTNTFMTKGTTVLGILFFVTCLSLAVLSSQKGKSLMSGAVTQPQATATAPLSVPTEESVDEVVEDVSQKTEEQAL